MTKKLDKNDTLKILVDLIEKAKGSKEKYRNSIQEAIELFVKEYNGRLTYNRTPFKAICQAVGNDAGALRAFLFKYTNITKIKYDFSFETEEAVAKTDSEGNTYSVYTLAFRDSYNGQKWWEQEKEKTQQLLTDATFEKSIKALINKYSKDDVEVNDNTKSIIAYLKTKVA